MKKKILLVDDEPNIHLLYRYEFAEEGYELLSAYTGKVGLRMFEEILPDLVILDIQLGDMNGIDILRRMKEARPEIPIILSSAFGEYKQDIACWASEDYIIKSSDLKHLKGAVARFIGPRGK